jgi:hypothetical protein
MQAIMLRSRSHQQLGLLPVTNQCTGTHARHDSRVLRARLKSKAATAQR